jgi:hypothetical protein
VRVGGVGVEGRLVVYWVRPFLFHVISVPGFRARRSGSSGGFSCFFVSVIRLLQLVLHAPFIPDCHSLRRFYNLLPF